MDEFVDEPEDEYDLIISNPPFIQMITNQITLSRDLACFEDALPFEELIEAAAFITFDNGNFSVIIPLKKKRDLLLLCVKNWIYFH